jgi:GTP-binding protein
VDGSTGSPLKDMLTLNQELHLFDPQLARKPQIVVINKIDLPEVKERWEAIEADLKGAGIRARYISAATGQGVSDLMKETLNVLKAAKEIRQEPVKIFRPRPREGGVKVTRQGNEYVIRAPGLERIMGGTGVTPAELRWQLNYLLQKMGVHRRLQKIGARPGDKIRCGDLTWEL